jgi:hypothetical protein
LTTAAKERGRSRVGGRISATRPAHVALLLAVWIIACKDEGTPGCTPITIPDPVACDGAAAPPWAIRGFDDSRAESSGAGVSIRMNTGESVQLRVEQAAYSGGGCSPTVDSVSWSVSSPAVASITATTPATAWIEALAPGETAIEARIVFKDSPPQAVAPRVYIHGTFADALVRVVSPPAPSAGAIRITQGTLALGSYGPDRTDWRATVPFATTLEGHLDVTVDWTMPANRVDAVVTGPCPGACVVIGRSGAEELKPLHLEYSRLPSASYPLRVDNLGSKTESASYEVWLTPGG